MKKMIAACFLIAFTAMIGITSVGFDKGPPGTEQTKVTKIEKENLSIAPLLAEYPAQFTTKEDPTGVNKNLFASSTAIKDAPALAVEDATLFYCKNNNDIQTRSRDVNYTKLGYSKAYWPV